MLLLNNTMPAFDRKLSTLLNRTAKWLDRRRHQHVPPLALKYLLLLERFTPGEIRDTFFHAVLETQRDGVIEFYEFIEIMLLVEMYSDKTMSEFLKIVKEVRTGVVQDRRSPRFGKTSLHHVPHLPESRREEFKTAFKFLDAQVTQDGVITEEEFLLAMRKYVWC